MVCEHIFTIVTLYASRAAVISYVTINQLVGYLSKINGVLKPKAQQENPPPLFMISNIIAGTLRCNVFI